MAPRSATTKKVLKKGFKKRTSQGRVNRPKNKHKRKNWKAYNRQGGKRGG